MNNQLMPITQFTLIRFITNPRNNINFCKIYYDNQQTGVIVNELLWSNKQIELKFILGDNNTEILFGKNEEWAFRNLDVNITGIDGLEEFLRANQPNQHFHIIVYVLMNGYYQNINSTRGYPEAAGYSFNDNRGV